jgi:hypothetical protein
MEESNNLANQQQQWEIVCHGNQSSKLNNSWQDLECAITFAQLSHLVQICSSQTIFKKIQIDKFLLFFIQNMLLQCMC